MYRIILAFILVALPNHLQGDEQAEASRRNATIARLLENERRAVKAFAAAGLEAVFAEKDGKQIPVIVGLSGNFGAGGGISGFYSIGSRVTDRELVHLKALPSVLRLRLEGSKVTDEGLRHLRFVPKLEHLSLWTTDITDRGLEHLAQLKNLRSLNLYKTKVTDAGLAKLRRLTNLEEIHLPDRISDKRLMELTVLPKLKEVDMLFPRPPAHISDEGIAKFKKALPNCKLKL